MGMGEAKAVDSEVSGVKSASAVMIILMNIWVPLGTLAETVFGIAVFPLLLVLWRVFTDWPVSKIMRHFVWIYGRVWMWIVSPFVRVECVGAAGRENPYGPSIFVANHLSLLDIFFLSAMPVFDVVIFLRSWPFRMAWYAPFMRLAEYLDVEHLPWEEITSRSEDFIKSGHSILIFPHGHRSRDGNLGRFYSGAFRLALDLNVPIVPICIKGTDRVMPPGRRWLAPSDVRLECLEPVEPSDFRHELGHIELRKHVKKLMGACLECD